MASPSKPKTVPQKEISTNNYIAAMIAITLIVVLVCGLIGKSMVGSLVVNTKVIAGKAKAKNDLDTKLTNIPILINNYNNLGNVKQLITDGLPTTPDFPQIVSILQSISTASGVTLKDVTPSQGDSAAANTSTATTTSGSAATPAPAATPASSSAPTPYIYTTTVAGPYTQIVNFFTELEHSDRPMHVTAAQFTGNAGILSVQVTVQTYYQGQADISDKTEPVK